LTTGFDMSAWSHLMPQASGNTVRTAVTADQLEEIILGGRTTNSGARVTADNSLGVAAVYACVRVLAESIAMLPMRLYDRSGAVPTPISGNLLDDLVYIEPNKVDSPFDFKRFLVVCLLLRGNHYALKVLPGTPQMRLVPLHPDLVEPEMDESSGEILYKYDVGNGFKRIYRQSDIVHTRSLYGDGIKGASVISAAREAIGLGMQAEQYGARLFSNGANPGIVLEHPGQMSTEAAVRLRDSFDERHSGAHNAHRTLLLEEGTKVSKIGMTSDELQFIESRKFQRAEIAMFFGVPPHMIGDIERGTSWGSGIEQQGIGFVTYTLRPWLTNITHAFNRSMLTKAQRRRLHRLGFFTLDVFLPLAGGPLLGCQDAGVVLNGQPFLAGLEICFDQLVSVKIERLPPALGLSQHRTIESVRDVREPGA